ncbi:site-specific integrase [Salinispora arenicola]|uniref:tyrosine-type recombinase/integrase n=1 Tax=Salinispora arenicola TaxID=168697 RepID=UPI00142FD582|nr:site-specific integrase [Salinispora arenicola]NIL40232.1 site-specific integrase [Salinispora arenicola]
MSGKRANGEGSIFPYRNGFAAYVWVTKPDGKRARKYVYGKTRDEVHDKWVRLHQQAKAGPVATNVPTVATYMKYWLTEIVEPNLAPLTYTTYETLSRLYIVPGIGAKRLDGRLSVREVQTWLNKVTKTCQCCAQGKDQRRPPTNRKCCAVGRCCQDLPSARTVKGIRAVLRSALAQAVVEELVVKNVAALVKLPPIRARKGKSWSSDEARTFLESARAGDDYLYAAYVLVLVLGLRKGEVLGLTWEHIAWDGWNKPCTPHGEEFCQHCRDNHDISLVIDKQLQRVRGQLLHRATKTEESDAPLPLPAICVTALRHRYRQQEAAREKAGDAWHETGMIFTTRYGLPVEPRNFNRSYDSRIARAGVPKITVHDARRTCGSLLVDLDVHPRVAMAILRHADFSITMEIYSQVSSKATREALRKLGQSLDQ